MQRLNTSFLKRFFLIATCFGLLFTGATSPTAAQTDDPFGDSAADPVRLFERGQSAHARGEFEKAIGFYEQALKVKPEFPEAEFQRGNALASLGRLTEAEVAFRLAISQKKNWSLPHSALGALLMRAKRDSEAEQSFRAALKVDAKDGVALRMLSEVRLRAGDAKEALDLAKRATAIPEAPASAWVVLAVAERANGNTAAAKATLDRILGDEPANVAALLERADLLTDEKNFESAIADLRAAAKVKPGEKTIMSRLAYALQQAGRNGEARSKPRTVTIPGLRARRWKNFSKRIRATQCSLVDSVRRIARTIPRARSISTDAPQNSNPKRPSTRLVMPRRWSRHVALPTLPRSCARCSA